MANNTVVINDARFLNAVVDELKRARNKFPGATMTLAALHEESGELAKAMLDHVYGKSSKEHIWDEAVQVAAMALRCAVEGDASMGFDGRDWD